MKSFSKIVFTTLFVFAASFCFAPPPAPGGGTNPACWPVCVPIDQGLIFLIVVVVLYGGIKIYKLQRSAKAKV